MIRCLAAAMHGKWVVSTLYVLYTLSPNGLPTLFADHQHKPGLEAF